MKFNAIIPAAGQGARAGGYKPLWSLEDEVVIDRVIRAARSVCEEVVVVGGAYFGKLKAHIARHHPNITLLENTNWRLGEMFSSVRMGLERVSAPVFVHPADIPGPGKEIYQMLAAALLRSDEDVFRPVYQGRGGHPILLRKSARQAALDAPLESNLKEALKDLRCFDMRVETEFVLRDFDTRSEFNRLRDLLA